MDASSTGVRRFFQQISTEEGVYGLILVSGLVAAAGGVHAPSFKILIFVSVTVIVFWLAHVYSGVVARHGRRDDDGQPAHLGAVIRHAIGKARGMLLAVVVPGIALLLGVFGIFDDTTATWVALWSCVGVLALLGFVAYSRLGVSWLWRIVGAFATASFGLIIIIAKTIVTH